MGFWEVIYPKKCLGCGRPGKYFCDRCLKTIEISDECFNHHLSLYCYKGIMREAIKRLKFGRLRNIESELAGLVRAGLEVKLTQPNTGMFREFLQLKPLVQPLPLHWFRRNQRGFNQAAVVAQLIAGQLKLPLGNYLVREKFSRPQSQLKRRERLTNVVGAFTVKKEDLPRAILLVDDVWTTGATMRAAAAALQDRGVKEIWGLSLAR